MLYRFVYPAERDIAPVALVRELAARVGTDAETAYLPDLRLDGMPDPREEIARRGGHRVASVARRRDLDACAFDEGLPYKQTAAISDPPEDLSAVPT